MHHASINEEVIEATIQRGLPSHHDSDETIIKCYMTFIKRDSWTWSKGCLPWLAWSSKSSGPSPSSSPTTSSNTGSNRRKKTTEK